MPSKKASARAGVPASWDSIVRYFESLPDPRHHRNRLHLLVVVITISVCGVIVGCSGPTAIAAWAKAKKDWLQELLELPKRQPAETPRGDQGGVQR